MLLTVSLRKNSDFLRVYKNGRHYAGKYLILYVLRDKPDEKSFDKQNEGSFDRPDEKPCEKPDGKPAGGPANGIALGVTASKKVGKSVRRNRIKRLIKENYRQYELYIRPGSLYVIVVRANPEGCAPDYYEIRREMRSLFLRAGVFDQQRWVSSQNGAS